jgi:hypothetical protein
MALTTPTDLTSFYEKRNTTAAKLLTEFNPLRLAAQGHGADPASTGPWYVFVTRPDLNLSTDSAKKFLGIGQPTAPDNIAAMLTGGGANSFIKMLTNLCDGYSVQDLVMDVHATGENWEGAKVSVPKSSLNSRQDGTLQLEYMELTGTPNTILHKIWFDYIEAVTKGLLNPKFDAPNYISKRMLDYAVSIYAFQMQPDGETIEFGTRWTGCYPVGVPYSVWGGKIGNSETIKIQVPYAYTYSEPMDGAIFYEFNTSAANQGVAITVETLPQSQRKVFKLKFTEGITLDKYIAG